MNKQKLTALLLLLVVTAVTATAQQTSSISTKEPVTVIELKRTFFKDSLNLNVDVSNLFWNKFDIIENREYLLHEQFKKDMAAQGIDLRKKEKLSKEQTIYVMQKKLEMKEKMLGLDKERFNTYQEILPTEIFIKYYDLDKQFKTELTKQFEESKRIRQLQSNQNVKLPAEQTTQETITIEAHSKQ